MKLLEWLCRPAYPGPSALVGIACMLLGPPSHAQQEAVFSGGSTKSTVTQETNSGLRSLSGSWNRQMRSDVPPPDEVPNQFARSHVVTAAGEQPLPGVEQRVPLAQTRAGAVTPQNAAEPVPNNSAQRIPLSEPGQSSLQSGGQSGGMFRTMMSVGSSLLIVVSLFLGVAWCYRRSLSGAISGALPKHVVNVLGRTPLAARQQLVLVRFGSKLVLVSLVQGEARTISEITDPLEVDRLAGLCESQQPGSITQSFRSVLSQGSTT